MFLHTHSKKQNISTIELTNSVFVRHMLLSRRRREGKRVFCYFAILNFSIVALFTSQAQQTHYRKWNINFILQKGRKKLFYL